MIERKHVGVGLAPALSFEKSLKKYTKSC